MLNFEQFFWLQFLKGFVKVKDNFLLDGMSQQFKDDDQILFDYEKYIFEMCNVIFLCEVDWLFYVVVQINIGLDVVVLVYV